MAKRDPKSQLLTVNFRCGSCKNKFVAEPEQVVDAPDLNHPFEYYCTCHYCGEDATQAPWEKALMASFGKHTGPTTEEGKNTSAANIIGHPTREEAQRTRFNAMKHGLNSRVATYFPAKPGKYPHCEHCEIDWGDCVQNIACMKRTELFMKHQIAFESGDPKLLNDIRSDLQSNIQAIIDDMILAIAADGVVLKSPKFHFDKDGIFRLAEYVDEDGRVQRIEDVTAHPLLKVLSEFISRNSLSLADLGMTPKVIDATEAHMGNLSAEKQDRESLLDYQRVQAESLEKLAGMIERSRQQISNDPIVIEHKENG